MEEFIKKCIKCPDFQSITLIAPKSIELRLAPFYINRFTTDKTTLPVPIDHVAILASPGEVAFLQHEDYIVPHPHLDDGRYDDYNWLCIDSDAELRARCAFDVKDFETFHGTIMSAVKSSSHYFSDFTEGECVDCGRKDHMLDEFHCKICFFRCQCGKIVSEGIFKNGEEPVCTSCNKAVEAEILNRRESSGNPAPTVTHN